MMFAPEVELANGVKIPALGLGTSPMTDDEAAVAIAAGVEAGYRLFDTAENYRNEVGVGRGLRDSGVDREQLFVTTKFNREHHSVDGAREAFVASSERLGLDHVDLLLIHWPNPQQATYVDAWRGMIRLLEEGKTRSIGVSNFKPAHLDRLIDETGVAPHVNQIQINPYITRADQRAYHQAHGIVTESYTPIGHGGDLLAEEPIAAAAEAHGRTPAQVVLRWHLQLGLVPIPKTQTPARLHENLDVFDFTLTDAQMDAITALDRGGEGAVDSDQVGH